MLRQSTIVSVLAIGLLSAGIAQARERTLDIYFIDVVGGAATLIVTPAGESILVDAGQALPRDAERILHVARKVAGLKSIDHMIVTHWHLDHYGAIGLMDGKIKFGQFYDRGIPAGVAEDPENFPRLIAAYKKAGGDKSRTLRAGDLIELKKTSGPELRLICLMASGETILTEGEFQKNELCDSATNKPEDTSENGQSIVLLLSYGDFDFYNGGDLTWNFEKQLVCPYNRVGQVELFQVCHHGLDLSNNPVLVHSIRPKTAIMCNGPRKGGDPEVLKTLRTSPGLGDLWALHRNVRLSDSDNPPKERVANWSNPEGGEFILVRVAPDGKSYTVQIGANGEPVQYGTWPTR